MKPWEKKEKKDAKDFGGTRVRGSGNQWNYPGDIASDKYLIEVKQTGKKSFGVSVELWDKISEEAAFSSDRIPLLSLLIQDTELIVLSKMDFLNILKAQAK